MRELICKYGIHKPINECKRGCRDRSQTIVIAIFYL